MRGGCSRPGFRPASGLLLVGIAELSHRRLAGSQTISGDRFRRSMAFQRLLHERERRLLIARFRNETFEDFTLVIDGAPQI
jgi:hypothetical protein